MPSVTLPLTTSYRSLSAARFETLQSATNLDTHEKIEAFLKKFEHMGWCDQLWHFLDPSKEKVLHALAICHVAKSAEGLRYLKEKGRFSELVRCCRALLNKCDKHEVREMLQHPCTLDSGLIGLKVDETDFCLPLIEGSFDGTGWPLTNDQISILLLALERPDITLKVLLDDPTVSSMNAPLAEAVENLRGSGNRFGPLRESAGNDFIATAIGFHNMGNPSEGRQAHVRAGLAYECAGYGFMKQAEESKMAGLRDEAVSFWEKSAEAYTKAAHAYSSGEKTAAAARMQAKAKWADAQAHPLLALLAEQPSPEDIKLIHEKIEARLEELRLIGAISCKCGIVKFDKEQDFVSFDSLSEEKETPWCLLSRGVVVGEDNKHIFDLVTRETAVNLVRSKKKHPITNVALKEVIFGSAVLDELDNTPTPKTIKTINATIETNLASLGDSDLGLTTRIGTIFLKDMTDSPTSTRFDPKDDKEWCLIPRDKENKIFDLVSWNAANEAAQTNKVNFSSIIRGDALLNILSKSPAISP